MLELLERVMGCPPGSSTAGKLPTRLPPCLLPCFLFEHSTTPIVAYAVQELQLVVNEALSGALEFIKSTARCPFPWSQHAVQHGDFDISCSPASIQACHYL